MKDYVIFDEIINDPREWVQKAYLVEMWVPGQDILATMPDPDWTLYQQADHAIFEILKNFNYHDHSLIEPFQAEYNLNVMNPSAEKLEDMVDLMAQTKRDGWHYADHYLQRARTRNKLHYEVVCGKGKSLSLFSFVGDNLCADNYLFASVPAFGSFVVFFL